MLVAPSIFEGGETGESNASFNTAPAPAGSQASPTALDDAPSHAANDAPVFPPKGTQPPRALLLGPGRPNATSSPNAAPISKPAAAPSSPTESKPAQSFEAPTASYAEHAQSTACKFDMPHTSLRAPRANLPPPYARRASAFRPQGPNTFISVNQRMALIETRVLQLESERNEQKTAIQCLTEKLERLIASLNPSLRAPIPIPVYDHIQALPAPGASRPLLALVGEENLLFERPRRGYSAPIPQCFWAPPTAPVSPPPPTESAVLPFQEPQPYPPPQHIHYTQPYPPPQQSSYNQSYPPPPAPVAQHYYPHPPQTNYPPQTSYPPPPPRAPPQDAPYVPSVQYPTIAPGYNS